MKPINPVFGSESESRLESGGNKHDLLSKYAGKARGSTQRSHVLTLSNLGSHRHHVVNVTAKGETVEAPPSVLRAARGCLPGSLNLRLHWRGGRSQLKKQDKKSKYTSHKTGKEGFRLTMFADNE